MRNPSQSEAPAPKTTVVFVTYNGLLDPLGPSQILPYLERLNDRFAVRILSFERPGRLADAAAVDAMAGRLRAQGMGWYRRRYHKWPSLPATTWDLMDGIRTLRRIIRAEPVGLIHARGYLPAAMAMPFARSHPLLFDIRGLQAEEYVDGGVWREGELKHRLLKRAERALLRRTAAAVVLTKAIRPYVVEQLALVGNRSPVEVIPCCVDMGRFRFDPMQRESIRRSLGLGPGTALFVYAGSLGTWYLPDAMSLFAKGFRDVVGRPVHLLWLVNNSPELAERSSLAQGLQPGEFSVRSARPEEMPGYLSASDAALALIRPSFSKRSSSPTKYAECLAAGLPLVIARDVGDGVDIEALGGAVALADPLAAHPSETYYRLESLMREPRARFRDIAARLFDIEQIALPIYMRLYQALALR